MFAAGQDVFPKLLFCTFFCKGDARRKSFPIPNDFDLTADMCAPARRTDRVRVVQDMDLSSSREDRVVSDILGKYVGENEANIREAFEEAEASGDVLLFDEADSFFSDRNSAHTSRESCLFLYRYFLQVADDRQQAFHWLKKLSAFGVPGDLRELSRAYERGTGCRRDKFLLGRRAAGCS